MTNKTLQIPKNIGTISCKVHNVSYHLFWLLSIIFIQCRDKESIVVSPKAIVIKEAYLLESNEDLDFIRNFGFAKDGSIWIGTFHSGVYRLSGDKIINFNKSNSPLPDNTINDLFIDNFDIVWVATGNGFAKYEEKSWKTYTIENAPLTLESVSQIAVNDHGEILIGNGNAVDGGLLFRNRHDEWKNYTTNNSELPCSHILDIKLSNNVFWVSTGQLLGEGGVVRFENEKVNNLLNIENTGLLYNWIDNIEVRDDNIWTGYEVYIYDESGFPDGGIQRVNLQSNNTYSYFPYDTRLVSNRITSMKLHSDNSLWFATGIDDPGCENCFAGIGVLLENEDFLAISAVNSDMPANAYFSDLKEDNAGNMYVSSELSLYQLELR